MQPSPQQLHGKVALITGASSGIGREAARLFARHGARLVLTARRQPELQALVAEIEQDGGQAIALAGDVRDEPLAQALVETATERFGGLDIAFNNAGMTGDPCALPDLSLQAWQDAIATNLTSAFLGAKHQIPALLARGGGSLIFTSTFVGHTAGLPGMGAYAASKAGLVGLTQVIAAEYGPRGLRANALLPGGTDTPMGRASTPTPEARAFVENLHALKRLATPAEIAAAALFLASDASSFITGTAMVVDGGVSINRI
ncbi:short-chain dehydrogenase/reductase SDR [Delftia acidovorans SPH-1]|uniref:Short-chain dehydrogenase/reductase SDR n=2 Tax=Delftia acidovorans TaxID=80866 RepID=A9C0L3_DELAS|nr:MULTISPECIES: SDR family oxidoreductase [Delftia]MCP4015863.1 SDR family oxidoreductase [Delftia sp.]OLE94119.1 MAG: short-chain dehydrogenase [Delftia sp. 13_1_40CM_3_66_6]HLB75878.1 SDR family oxidoreductase [Candidatus Dormibacteraeota bacterium]ABX37086.1 short-chain dehydrogenase/reductase SDR [Delftia acidovorans SPH-1]MBN9324031.1 SDR family oxidoreductase [Delftia acidovorans]